MAILHNLLYSIYVTKVSNSCASGLYMKFDMKTDRYGTGESHIAFWSGLPHYLHVWGLYEIHIGVDLTSVILTDLKLNT